MLFERRGCSHWPQLMWPLWPRLQTDLSLSLQRQQTILFFELVCFQTVVFPLRKAVSYVTCLWRDKATLHRLEYRGYLELLELLKLTLWGFFKGREKFVSANSVQNKSWEESKRVEKLTAMWGGVLMQGGVRLCQVYANHLPLRRHSFTWSCWWLNTNMNTCAHTSINIQIKKSKCWHLYIISFQSNT